MSEKTYDPIKAHNEKRKRGLKTAAAAGALIAAGGLALHMTEVNPSAKSEKAEEQTIEGMMNGQPAVREQGVLVIDSGVNTRKSPDVVNDDSSIGTQGNKDHTVKSNEKLVVVDPIKVGNWYAFVETKDNDFDTKTSVGEIADQLTWVYAGPENQEKVTLFQGSMSGQEYGAVIRDGQIVDADSEQAVKVAQGQYMSNEQAQFMVDAVHSQVPQK